MKPERLPTKGLLALLFLPVFLVMAFLAVSQPAWSQEVTAAITGTITDPSGAPIAGAKVIAKNVAQGTDWPTQTNAAGVYDLPRLPIGTYDVTVEVTGFQTAVQRGITLELNQKARVDLQLKLGAVSQTVEVTGVAPLLKTDNMQVDTIINDKVTQDLPLATRNYIQLTLLSPGVVHPDPSTLTNGQNQVNGGRPYVNGNREQSDNFLLDGLDNNQVSDNLVGFTPSVDALQEFNLITNNAPAEFGNYQGGIVSATIKSGTNSLHGDAFEFLRNNVLNAAQWSNNIFNNPKALVRWNMFGGTIGGPIKKDKIFFFGDYQGERFDTPAAVGPVTVFTAAERQGNFGALCSKYDASGLCVPVSGQPSIQLYNPCASFSGPCQQPATSGNRQPFPNNVIPMSMIDPVATNLFSASYYPAPINSNLTNNQLNSTGTETSVNQYDVKIDANATQKDRIFGRYSQSWQSIPVTDSFPLYYGSFNNGPTQSGVIDWTRTINPSIVNEARFGVNYVQVHNGGTPNSLGNVSQQLGIQGVNGGLLALNFSGGYVSSVGSSNIGTQQLFADTVIQAEDNLIITKGHHTVHTGVQYWRQRINTFYAGNNGRTGLMDYDGRWTAGPTDLSVAGSGTGAGEADFFLGLPDTLGRGVQTGTWGQRANVFAAYVQDQWRATSSLTINAGLRYETHTPWAEVHNRQANFGIISGTEYLAGQTPCPWSNCRALYNSYNAGLDFQPRLGFAWTPERLGKTTVIRGAYTVSSYLEGTGTNLRLPLNPPFNEEFNATYVTQVFPSSTSTQGLTTLSSPSNPFTGAVIREWDPNVQPAIAQQWNFSLERQFRGDMVFTVGYVGQHGTHLMVPMPYFQLQLLAPGVSPTTGKPVTAPSPFLSGNPALDTINQISGTASIGNMSYNALQATWRKRFSQGLTAQVAYTYSKCLTNSSGYYGSWGGQTTPTSPYFQNLYDSKAEWGPCYYDVTNVLSSYAVYELPFGRNKKWGKSWNGVANGFLGNWQAGGILQLHGGYPITISASDASGTNSRGPRANCIGPDRTLDTNYVQGGLQWFDPASYAAPAPGYFGSCAPATTRGPGLTTFDLSLQKEIPVTESKRFEFRTEFINFTNTPILNSPSGGLGAGLGTIQSSQGARNIQFALKFYF